MDPVQARPSLPVPGTGADPEAEIASQLKRVFAGFRLYGVDHESSGQLIDGLFERMTRFLEGGNDLCYLIDATTMKVGERKVLEDERREDSITRALFADGIQAITFHRGMTKEELSEILGIWFSALAGSLEEEHSFATLIWERDFANISTSIQSGLAEEGVADPSKGERVNRLNKFLEAMTEHKLLSTRTRQEVLVDALALAVITRVEALKSLTREDLDRRATADRAALPDVSSTDKSALVAGVTASSRGAGQRALFALWRSLPDADPLQRAAVVDLVAKIVRTLIEDRRLGELYRAVLRVAPSESSGATDADRELFLACLQDTEVMTGLIKCLRDPELAADSMALLQHLPDERLEDLIEPIAGAPAETRARLVQLIVGRAPDPVTVAEWALAHREEHAPGILQIAQQLGAEHLDFVIRACLTHDDPRARLRGLKAIKTEQVPSFRSLIERRAEDEQIDDRSGPRVRSTPPGEPAEGAQAERAAGRARVVEVRIAALQLLLRSRGESTEDLLVQILERPDTPIEISRICILGLASLGGPFASSVLSKILREHQNTEMRRAAALALGTVADDEAIALLRSEARRLLGDRGVRQAAKEALRRIERKNEGEAVEELPDSAILTVPAGSEDGGSGDA